MSDVQQVEAAYNTATGAWRGADWTHYLRVDGYDVQAGCDPVVCDGDNPSCETCDNAAKHARTAEILGAYARDCARAGEWADALEAAQGAAYIERQWGDAPVWGPFTKTIEQVLDKQEEGKQ